MLWVSTADAQSIVRGRVQGADGPIAGVVINEITRENRILNSTVTDGAGLYNISVSSLNNALSVKAEGYTRHIERLLGRTDVDMELTEYTSLVDEELLAARHRYYDSYKLFSGRNGQRRVPQLVRVEMLNDTLFTLTIPLWVFKVTASSASSTLDIKVTDRFGNVYTETMTRPKAFTTDQYKF